jgi:hypothetical protein
MTQAGGPQIWGDGKGSEINGTRTELEEQRGETWRINWDEQKQV